MKEEKSVIIEAAVADLMQFAELLIWENPEIQKKMQEMDLKPEDVKAGIQGKKMEKETLMVGICFLDQASSSGSRIKTPEPFLKNEPNNGLGDDPPVMSWGPKCLPSLGRSPTVWWPRRRAKSW